MPRIAQVQESFFVRPVGKWFTLLALLLGIAVWGYTAQLSPTTEQTLKLVMLTLPAMAYCVYRSFIRQE